MTTDPRTLLEQYVENQSEAAFRELVERYVNLVYSSALRLVNGDTHLAEDVVQMVFADLARLAGTLSGDVQLGGWLHRRTCHVATTLVRSNRRRQHRESQSVEMNALHGKPDVTFAEVAPLLDEAINQLNALDRTAIVLRFFEQRDLHSIGLALGSNEDAAQKRVTRALEKLRLGLERRGVLLAGGALFASLGSQAVTAAPAGLAASVSSAALASATATTGFTFSTLKLMAITKFKTAIVGVLLVTGAATTLVVQHRAQATLKDENTTLRQQLQQQAQLAAENERLTGLIEQTVQTNAQLLPGNQLNELLRLRGEVTRLRSEAREFARSSPAAAGQEPVNRLRQELAQMPERNIPELQYLEEKKWVEDAGRGKLDTEDGVRQTLGRLRNAAKIRFGSRFGAALSEYLKTSNGQLPGDISELKPYFTLRPDEPRVDDSMLQRYELLHQGKLSDLPAGEALIAEKAPVDDQYDTLFTITADYYSLHGVGQWSRMAVTNTWAYHPPTVK